MCLRPVLGWRQSHAAHCLARSTAGGAAPTPPPTTQWSAEAWNMRAASLTTPSVAKTTGTFRARIVLMTACCRRSERSDSLDGRLRVVRAFSVLRRMRTHSAEPNELRPLAASSTATRPAVVDGCSSSRATPTEASNASAGEPRFRWSPTRPGEAMQTLTNRSSESSAASSAALFPPIAELGACDRARCGACKLAGVRPSRANLSEADRR